MTQPTSPSPPHRSDDNNKRHVDIRGADKKVHATVKNSVGATAVGGYMRDQARKDKGRGKH